jgi:hypothetical protein
MLTAIYIKDNGKMGWQTVSALSVIHRAASTRVSGPKTSSTAKARSTGITTKLSIKETSFRAKRLGWANSPAKEAHIKENSWMACSMARASITLPTRARFIKEVSKRISQVVWER